MSDRSTIEWTNATWNPVTGCTKVSPGCDHCYAETFAERFRGVRDHPYEQGFDLKLWPERLEVPLRWRTPRLVFVNSMSDLFQDGVPIEFVRRVWATMAATPQHTYQILTKRPGVMASHLRRIAPSPLSNVWLGTSVEDQKRARLRVPKLLEVPAAVRFLSCEPLLGNVDLMQWVDGIDWVIVGGESGPGARPMDLLWARSIVHQCAASNVSCFVKQLGSRWARAEHSAASKGGEMHDWPRDLRVRELPPQPSRLDLVAVNSVP
ncbi:MAG: DUF5131 family protein [Actinomycetota bacterium]